MPSRLYARDPILRALVPRLVGSAYDRRNLVPQEHPDDRPVVLLTGRRGMGRTAILDALEEAYRERVPVAKVDAARLGPEEAWPAVAASNTSDVVVALERLVCALAPPVAGIPRLRFARSLPGLLAVSSWHLGDAREKQLAGTRSVGLLVACRLLQEDTDGTAWTDDVSGHLPDQQPDDLTPVVRAIIGQYFSEHTRARNRRAVEEWYRGHFPGTDDGESALVRLSQRFHQGGDFRQAAERILVTAFLSDLDDAYGRWQRVNRTPRPLVLLDNVQTEAGQRLLDLLLERRAASPEGARDPLAVVATWRGDGALGPYPDAVRRELPEVAVASGWQRFVPGSPSAGLLIVPLPPLDRDDVLAMLDSADGPIHHYLPSAVHALTRGHTQGTKLLCEAVIRVSGENMVAPRQLLDLPGADGRPVGELLLEQLIPQPQLRAPLVLAALACDGDAAQALTQVDPAVRDKLPAAARFLAEEHGTAVPAGQDGADFPAQVSFVRDPLLRSVLVHEARRNGTVAESGKSWLEIHRLLRDHHDERGQEQGVLRHTLATGDATSVGTELAARFAREEADRWLDTLRYVATAPSPPEADWADQRLEAAQGHHDRDYAEADDVWRSINRLLHLLWHLGEPFAEPTTKLCNDMANELTFLSMRHTTGHAVLDMASQTWPRAARERRPYPIAHSK